jgi:hypothetical protein
VVDEPGCGQVDEWMSLGTGKWVCNEDWMSANVSGSISCDLHGLTLLLEG